MIKPATTDHAAELADLQARVHGDEAWTAETWRRKLDLDQTVVWRAVDDGDDESMVGYIAVWRLLDRLEITDLVVDPDERRGGIGTAMLESVLAVARARGVRAVRLEVREDNRAAIELYRSLDFRIVDRRPDFYDDGAQAFVMRRIVVD